MCCEWLATKKPDHLPIMPVKILIVVVLLTYILDSRINAAKGNNTPLSKIEQVPPTDSTGTDDFFNNAVFVPKLRIIDHLNNISSALPLTGQKNSDYEH